MSKTIKTMLALTLYFVVQGLNIGEPRVWSQEGVSLGDNYVPGEERYFALGIDISGSVINLYDRQVYLGSVEYRKLVQHNVISVDKEGAKLAVTINDVELKPYLFDEPVSLNLTYELGLLGKEATIMSFPDGRLSLESSLPDSYSDLNGDALGLVFVLLNRLYPTEAINTGDSWKIEQPLTFPLGAGNSFQGKLAGEARLRELTENGWLAGFRGELTGGIQYKGGVLLLGGEITGPINGEIYFNSDKGNLENLKLTGNITGELSGVIIVQPFRLSINAELGLVAKRFYPHSNGQQ